MLIFDLHRVSFISRIYSFFFHFSPSGTALRKIEQIKEYLLRHGTCKCGLPCPLRPDFFFDFNPQVILQLLTSFNGSTNSRTNATIFSAQVPNSPLQIPLEHESNATPCCLHTSRFVDQQNRLPSGKWLRTTLDIRRNLFQCPHLFSLCFCFDAQKLASQRIFVIVYHQIKNQTPI